MHPEHSRRRRPVRSRVRWSQLWLVCAALVLAAGAVRMCSLPASPPYEDAAAANRVDAGPPAHRRGQQLYTSFCEICHGREGRGDGPAAGFCSAPPADFTRAEFKVRSTPSGSLPTDEDVARVIRNGAGSDGMMPAFPFLQEEDLALLVAEVKRFSPRWMREPPAAPLQLPMREPGNAARGATVYRAWGCDACHGAAGRGDGRSAAALRHTRGHIDAPTDLTRPWSFRAPGDIDALARSILTGFAGTAMPGYQVPAGREHELWDLAEYVRSLQHPRPSLPGGPTVETSTVGAYWTRPVVARGINLSATSCAACHPRQFMDWSRSQHAAAMGPGVWAQMHEQPELTPSCAGCHAPLDLQARDPYLMADGVGCASCHLRAHEAFGPAPSASTLVGLVAEAPPPHGTVNVRPFFEQADFCGTCHQFAPGEAPVVHGTTLQNTVEEWRASRAAREGRTCQSCHMPDRRHYFRGIHDPETVRAALGWSFDARRSGGRVTARLTLTNVAVGHAFPTYVVPQVWMRIELLDERGAIRASSERLVARTVTFSAGTWSQVADTRLLPDQTATLIYDGPVPPGVRTAVGRVVVLPDAWHADSFRDRLSKAKPGQSRRYYAAALDEVQKTGYTLFRLERNLDSASH